METSSHVDGKGGRFRRRDLNNSQSAVFQTLTGEGGGVDKDRLNLIATWSLREGVSWILQLQNEGLRDGLEKVRSMMVADLWFENVGWLPKFKRSAPELMRNSSKVLPLGLSLLQPHSVL